MAELPRSGTEPRTPVSGPQLTRNNALSEREYPLWLWLVHVRGLLHWKNPLPYGRGSDSFWAGLASCLRRVALLGLSWPVMQRWLPRFRRIVTLISSQLQLLKFREV
jgi:hypothetical protein